MKQIPALVMLTLMLVGLAGVPIASAQDDAMLDEDLLDEYVLDEQAESIADPLRGFNRAMFTVNDRFYFWLLKPAATGYRAVTPVVVRKGIRNFFYNLAFPVRFVNCLLQAKGTEAGAEMDIFLINTTVGLLGFMQPAQDRFNITGAEEDLGQSLGTWTIGEGFYLVLPVLGPSTLRDTVGSVGDWFLDPTSYISSWEASLAVGGLETVNSASFRIGDYETLKEASLDPYVAMKDAYVKMRRERVAN